MRRLSFALVCVVLSAARAAAQIATFDDLRGCVPLDVLLSIHTPNFNAVPNGYVGFDWTNFFVLDGPSGLGEGLDDGFANGTVSPHCIALNGAGLPAEITSATPFTYNGGYFTDAREDDGVSLRITGFFGQTSLFTEVLTLSSAGPQLFDVNWTGVNRVRFESATGTPSFFVFDNMRFNNAPNATAAPEPSTWALVTTGLVFVGYVARRRRRRAC